MGGVKRDFKGVWIPKEIWINKDISASEKLIFVEIHSLDNEFGCVAKNVHFAEMFGLAERTVQHIIKRLKEKGLISVEIKKSNDSRVIRVAGRFARISKEQVQELTFMKAYLSRQFTTAKGRHAA